MEPLCVMRGGFNFYDQERAMNKKYELKYLTEDFFNNYPTDEYPEIEHKPQRPYMVLLVTIADNTFAIPFRTNIKHNNGYKFKNSSRDTNSDTGLDYTKAVIVNDPSYIGKAAYIDDKEYLELNNKYYFIIKQFTVYVNDYYAYVAGKLDENKAKKYKYSTLRYFHRELHIINADEASANESAEILTEIEKLTDDDLTVVSKKTFIFKDGTISESIERSEENV